MTRIARWRAPGRRGRPEQQLQILVADWLRWALAPPATWNHFPAGGGGEARGRALKRAGLTAGWPDLVFVHQGRFYGIELKTGGGTTSAAQRLAHETLRAAGSDVAVCRSLDEVRAVLVRWGLPLRTEKPSTTAIKRMVAEIVAERDG